MRAAVRVNACAGGAHGGGGQDDARWANSMSRLRRRISQTRDAAVVADRTMATNWKRANFRMAYLGQASSSGGAVMALEVRDGLCATATAVGEVCVQSLPHGAVVAQLASPADVAGELTSMDFDGSHVVAGFASGEIAAWDIGPMIVMPKAIAMGDADDGERFFAAAPGAADAGDEGDGRPADGHADAESAHAGLSCDPVFVGVHSDLPVTGVRIHGDGAAGAPDLGPQFFPSFVSSSADGVVRCWGGLEARGSSLRSARGPVCCVNTIGEYVCAGTMTGHIQIWRSFHDYGSDEIEPILSFRAHDAQITALQHSYSGGGETLITGGADGLVKVWDMERGGKPVHQFRGHDDGITSVQSDSSKVVTAGLDNTVRVWDWSTGKQLYRLNGEATDAISARFEGPWLVWNGLSRNVLLMDYSG